MDPLPQILVQFAIIAVLTWINAFFASAEMAVVSCNKNKIENLAEEGSKNAQKLLEVTADQTRFLSTIQVGITLAGFFSSGSASTTISKSLGNYLVNIGIKYGVAISFVATLIILSYITLVFGELVPKRVALQNPEEIALKRVGAIALTTKIFYPFVRLLSITTVGVLKLMGKYSEDVEEKISEEELKSYIRVSKEAGVINLEGEEMIVNIMDFDDKMAYEIMTPRTDIYMIDKEDFNSDIIEEILESGYSRVPVYDENPDNILGIVNIKDLFDNYSKNNFKSVDLNKILKPCYFVPETKKIDRLLKELQISKTHMAILIDEYGGLSGMVTMEDIIEEIVGEIEDEFDKEDKLIEKINDRTYMVEGKAELSYIADELNLHIDSENHETLGGLVLELLGYIPDDGSKGDTCIYDKEDKIKLTTVKVDENRIEKVKLEILETESEKKAIEEERQ